MRGLLIDSNVILDIFLDDPNWAEQIELWRHQHTRGIHVPLKSIRVDWMEFRNWCM